MHPSSNFHVDTCFQTGFMTVLNLVHSELNILRKMHLKVLCFSGNNHFIKNNPVLSEIVSRFSLSKVRVK